MGEVGGPDQPIHSHVMAHLHSDGVVEKSPIDVLLDVLAGESLQRLETKQFLGPSVVPLEAQVGHVQEEGQPPGVGFCVVHL